MSRRQRLGQHFLVDGGAIERIVEALDARAGDAILEIGPGRGALTEPLIRAVGRIAAVELDPDLAAELRRRHDPGRLALFEGDFLSLPLAEVARALDSDAAERALLLVGNLPYSISKRIAQKLIRDRARIDRAVLMFQREVAECLTARPRSRAYGPLTVLAGQFFEIRPLFDLAPHAFRPPPEVHSRVTHWQRRALDTWTADSEARLRRCLAAAFARRRRTIRNNLRAALRQSSVAEAVLEAAGIDGRLRAEELDPALFLRLADAWVDPPSGSAI